MKIVIAGAGEVGFYLARLLSNEAQDIIVIDDDPQVLSRASNELDVITLKGNASSVKLLKEAKVGSCDLLIAVTSSESDNFMIATFGKQLGAKRTIARVNNVEFLDTACKIDFKALGIDVMISPEDLAAREISRLIKRSAFTDAFEFEDGKMSLLGINLDSDAPVVNKTIAETAVLNPHFNFITVAIQRDGRTIVPRGDATFLKGDHVYFLAVPEGVDEVLKLTGKEEHRIRNVMMLGGSRVALNTINKIKKRRNIKLIERNAQKSFDIADDYPDILIINEDGHNVKMLDQESITEMDAFVAVTGNSETNIMTCLVAKAKGVKKTIALVENMDYINLSQNIGIDTLINKKLIAANSIFRYVRQGDVITIAGLHGVNAEILEFEAKENSLIVKKPIRELKFPREAIIGGVIRDNKGRMMRGEDQVMPGDRVVVLVQYDNIKDIERFF
ncbi:MAG: Trk system potassium transporter TrkA [Flavobacteriales bacterium]|nr:Trk system potassium transporter TrkA [Bacteroidota bacterium]MCB9241445.1 Trk system potassium transporter TrkA [Flavobacteriales bacterium]